MVLTRILPFKTSLSPSLENGFTPEFISALLSIVENEGDDNLCNSAMNLLLAINLSFAPHSVVMDTISKKQNCSNLITKLLIFLKRGFDPVYFHNSECCNSVMKFYSDMFTNESTACLFRTDDVKIIAEILIRDSLSHLSMDGKTIPKPQLELLHLILKKEENLVKIKGIQLSNLDKLMESLSSSNTFQSAGREYVRFFSKLRSYGLLKHTSCTSINDIDCRNRQSPNLPTMPPVGLFTGDSGQPLNKEYYAFKNYYPSNMEGDKRNETRRMCWSTTSVGKSNSCFNQSVTGTPAQNAGQILLEQEKYGKDHDVLFQEVYDMGKNYMNVTNGPPNELGINKMEAMHFSEGHPETFTDHCDKEQRYIKTNFTEGFNVKRRCSSPIKMSHEPPKVSSAGKHPSAPNSIQRYNSGTSVTKKCSQSIVDIRKYNKKYLKTSENPSSDSLPKELDFSHLSLGGNDPLQIDTEPFLALKPSRLSESEPTFGKNLKGTSPSIFRSQIKLSTPPWSSLCSIREEQSFSGTNANRLAKRLRIPEKTSLSLDFADRGQIGGTDTNDFQSGMFQLYQMSKADIDSGENKSNEDETLNSAPATYFVENENTKIPRLFGTSD